jgi:hypothetical protein
MKCNICGRQSQNEEANFCDYCGSSFREHVHMALNSAPKEIDGEAGGYSESMAMLIPGRAAGQTVTEATGNQKPLSFLYWLGMYGLLLIPFIGIVQLFIWAFSNKIPASKKNWAGATLIFLGVIILIVYFLILFMVVNSPLYQEMLGTFDYNSYFNSMNNPK